MVRQRLDTKQAAEALGITPDAVRKRVSRGLLESEKEQDGKLYIWLDNDTPSAGHTGQDGSDRDRDMLIEFLRSELALWQEEARRKDHIIAALTERIPELEAPRAARESPVSSSEESESSTMPLDQEEPKSELRSWWRRLFDPPA